MKYNTVILDLDGTLLDTLEDLKNSVNYVLNEYHHKPRTLSEIRSFIGNGVKILLTRSFPAETPALTIEEALPLFRAHYDEHMYDHTDLYEGISPMLLQLNQMGIKLAIVSNKMDQAVKKLNESFFTGLIDIAIGTPSNAKKPNPYSVLEAIQLLNSKPEEAIYVGDSDVDIATAHNANLPCIGVSWGFRGRDFLHAYNADFIIDSPMELPELLKRL